MKLPPPYFTPGTWSPKNGDLPAGTHASEIDAFCTWLATRRLNTLGNVGAVMSNETYSFIINVPQYSEHVGFIIFAAGEGDLVLKCSQDAYDATIEISGGGSTRDLASYYFASTPTPVVGSHTIHRSLNLNDVSSSTVAVVGLEVPSTIYVWEVAPFILPRIFGNELPA